MEITRSFDYLKTNFGEWILGIEFNENKEIKFGFANNEFDIRPNSPAWKDIKNVNGDKAAAAKYIINYLSNEPTIKITEDHWKTRILDLVLPLEFPTKVVKCCKYCKYYDENSNCCLAFTNTGDSLDNVDITKNIGCNSFEKYEY